MVIGIFRNRLREGARDYPETAERGRDEFYAEYTLHVCAPLREARFVLKG